ncbi:hypothetical protein [Desertimonas flava]|uniref:baeRF3 domain-containing protein n=1 Tax=Desertimonas flava TaxID=2064846 RepID=UPI000E34A879|nr:hypothetical protein [Desertimonas flava]
MQRGPWHHIDVVTTDDLLSLDGVAGPCVSLYLPTHRYGPDVRQGPVVLRNQLAEVRRGLEGSGWRRPDIDDFLEPLNGLVSQDEFWQYQGAGLALFRAPDLDATHRLPLDVDEHVDIGDSFRVAPLVPLVSGDGAFFILALSQNEVRLFEATRQRIGEVELTGVPRSMDEALAHEDPERQLQFRSAGQGAVQFHGHGAGDEVDKARLERYIRAVATGIDERLRGSGDRPLVLASVAYYLPIFKAASSYRGIVDDLVEGSPDGRPVEDLHRDAWQLVESTFTGERDRLVARYRVAAGTGLTSADLDEIVDRATEGRVETLFVAPDAHDDRRVDQAILATLRTNGRLWNTTESLDRTAGPLAALLRY